MGNGYKKKHQSFSVHTTSVGEPPQQLITTTDIIVNLPGDQQQMPLGEDAGLAAGDWGTDAEPVDVAELDGALIDLLPNDPQPGWTESVGVFSGTGVVATDEPGVGMSPGGNPVLAAEADHVPDPATGKVAAGGWMAPTAVQEDLTHAAQAKLDVLADSWAATAANDELTATQKYQALNEIADSWRDELEVLLIEGGYEPYVAEQRAKLRAMTTGWLESLPVSTLQQVAADAGYQYPTLLSPDKATAQGHALIHGLDPAYPAEMGSKLKIWQKAQERYNALASGQVSDWSGVTLADVDAAAKLHAAPTTPVDEAPWDADADALKALANTTGHASEQLARYRKVVAAKPVDQAAADMQELVINGFVNGSDIHNDHFATIHDAEALIDSGVLPGEANLLTPNQAFRLAHPDTAGSVRVALLQLAQQRAQDLDKHAKAVVAGQAAYDAIHNLPKIGPNFTPEQAAAKYEAAFKYRPADYDWTKQVVQSVPLGVSPMPVSELMLKANLKGQPLKELRQTAKLCGLANAEVANRADVTAYMVAYAAADGEKAAQIHSAIADAVKAQAAAKAAQKAAAAKPTPAPAPHPPVQPSPGASPAAVVLSNDAPKKAPRFKSSVLVMRAKIKSMLGLKADLPQRMPLEAVQHLKLTNLNENPGGAHSKDVLSDGSGKWLSKPDKTAGGVRARSEAIVSELSEALGMPTVPVYAVNRGGHVCSIQPMVKDATQLGHNAVATADQATADLIMREAPFSMLVGDWDGSEANWLRTPNHGLVRCDAGQAFRFWGKDDSGSLAYKPNASYGQVSLHIKLLEQTRDGGGSGGGKANVAAALPTLHRIEAMPDAQLRQILAPIAESGAMTGEGVFWYSAMRAKAEAKHGSGKVGAAEVAEAFLDHAVERKHGLRSKLRSLCVEAGVDVTALDHDPYAPKPAAQAVHA
ncbi:MAG TPA: hypothetical protein VHD87_15610 [Acidimicrobiales bacterium]|nr:hypothetical protein [Acidimicrobiales bacterium]